MMVYLTYKDRKKDYLYTMNRFKLLYLSVLCLFLTACQRCIIPWYRHNLLVYMAADNTLSDLAAENMDELIVNSFVPSDHALFVFTDRTHKGAFLIRIKTKNKTPVLDTLYRYGSVNSALPEVLKQAIDHARDKCPADTYGLILWSHGTGWLPKGLYGEIPRYSVKPLSEIPAFEYDINDPAYPRTKTFGQDGKTEMEIPDLVAALSDYHHEYICFDACLMADIQTYYQLKDACDYILGSPAEIIDTGYPYDRLTSVLFPYRGQTSLTALCDAYFNKYDSKTGYNRSATISLVRTEHIQGLARAFKTLIKNGGMDPQEIDRSELQTYDRLTEHVFWDIDQMAGMLGHAEDYENFRTILNKTVVYKKTTENFITIPIKHYSGLAAYLPTQVLPRTQTAFQATSWNKYLKWIPVSK
ncbi:MAG: Clostripain family protein [Bacteroidetes bacterium ADurb.Bin037]|nr:MAG: Clostripain family protein [Bacteroidetes bacterium ADurb.Bin037]